VSAHRLTVTDFAPPAVIGGWRMRSLIVGGVAAILAIIGFVISPQQALHSYLAAFMLTLGLSLGSMAWLMVWHLTGGSWGVPIRRILEAAIATLPLLVVAWIPIAIGMHAIYPWAHAAEKSAHASPWLTPWGFVLRGLVYFLIWGVIAWLLLHISHEQDVPPERAFGARLRGISGVGLVVYAWSLTFASVDWVMSLTPGWTSTIYGLIFMVGQGLLAMCFVVIASHWLRAYEPMAAIIRPHNYHDYGKLMLTFVMLWAYFNFSQWLIIWGGNLPEEAKWFLERIHGGWGYVAFAIIIGQFALPFCLLLSRPLKRNSATLFWVAAWLVLMRYVDLYWNITPALHKEDLHLSWLDLVMPVALVGLWLAYFFWNLARRPMLAVYDPHVPVFLESEHD
jgi:hypothetical protein